MTNDQNPNEIFCNFVLIIFQSSLFYGFLSYLQYFYRLEMNDLKRIDFAMTNFPFFMKVEIDKRDFPFFCCWGNLMMCSTSFLIGCFYIEFQKELICRYKFCMFSFQKVLLLKLQLLHWCRNKCMNNWILNFYIDCNFDISSFIFFINSSISFILIFYYIFCLF